jgi:hypothetical protein
VKDYAFGNHPLWEVFRASYQMTRKPYVIGGLSLLTGYEPRFRKALVSGSSPLPAPRADA